VRVIPRKGKSHGLPVTHSPDLFSTYSLCGLLRLTSQPRTLARAQARANVGERSEPEASGANPRGAARRGRRAWAVLLDDVSKANLCEARRRPEARRGQRLLPNTEYPSILYLREAIFLSSRSDLPIFAKRSSYLREAIFLSSRSDLPILAKRSFYPREAIFLSSPKGDSFRFHFLLFAPDGRRPGRPSSNFLLLKCHLTFPACDVAPAHKSEPEPTGEGSRAGAMWVSGARRSRAQRIPEERPGGRRRARAVLLGAGGRPRS